jgi:dipeptidyl aminopeptidase/acylaminoacyl peptidase
MRQILAVLAAAALTLTVTPAASADESRTLTARNINSASIPIAMTREYDGRDLKIRKKLSENSSYTRYKATYKSGDLKICGILIRPKGKGPFPMVVLAHGYIDPKIYVSGQGFRREQDWLPRNGYGVLHTDYRNHACSDKDPRSDVNMRLGYAEDVINAGLAIRNSDIPWIDDDRVAVLGRSMGGGVTYQALTIAPGVFDAAITYASTSTDAADNFNKWQRNNYDIGDRILKKYGEPKDNPETWKRMSSRNYFFRITEPVLSFHGTKDDSCDISWARATERALDEAGVENQLVEYKGAGHYFYGPWSNSIKRVGTFLDKHLAEA